MWAIGVYDLRLESEVVWLLTLRQFVALLDRQQEAIRREDERAGQIVAMLYNVNRDATKDPKGATWLDFFPRWGQQESPQTDEQMYEAMMMWSKATSKMRA